MPSPTDATPWLTRPYRRQWLRDEAESLFVFYGNRSFDPAGSVFELTATGTPIKSTKTRRASSIPPRAQYVASPLRAFRPA